MTRPIAGPLGGRTTNQSTTCPGSPRTNGVAMKYGSLLGEYFTVVSRISELETAHPTTDLTDHPEYRHLLEERDHLKQRLDSLAGTKADSDVKQVLDEAFENL